MEERGRTPSRQLHAVVGLRGRAGLLGVCNCHEGNILYCALDQSFIMSQNENDIKLCNILCFLKSPTTASYARAIGLTEPRKAGVKRQPNGLR